MDEEKVSFIQKFLDFISQDDQEEQIEKEDEEEMEQDFQVATETIEKDTEKQIVKGVVLRAGKVDLEKDLFPKEVVEQTAYDFLKDSQTIGLAHQLMTKEAVVVESYIAPTDFEIGKGTVNEGDWVLGVKILDDDLWKMVKDGKFNAFSIAGKARKIPAEGD